ncbi:carbohydrate esterase family 16 protein [Roridomyces roridus]|uniref:Carbohydrate esterase family 16 protein n=1 Tax=Roridomyces roridus TaxID=1738132 RepID=A0AAD7FAG8_9AGAR|nr:carbohydrate esterase family 16 protein [Roridomyces roridus]
MRGGINTTPRNELEHAYSSMLLVSLFASSALLFASASVLRAPRTSGVHLAVSPQCGTLASGVPADVNVGLKPLKEYKNIVAFGDSYTGGSTNGPTWVQNLATSAGATLINYAATGAVVDVDQWPEVPAVQAHTSVDFINQANGLMYGSQQKLDPSTTLYVIFLGIGDYAEAVATNSTTSSLNQIAGVLLYTLLGLVSSPVSFANDILLIDNYGLGLTSPLGDTFKTYLFEALGTGRRSYGWNVGFASLNSIWEGVLYDGATGYEAFGYTSPGVCDESCAEPGSTFYWTAGNPSAATHAIMAEYVEEVLTQCQSST